MNNINDVSKSKSISGETLICIGMWAAIGFLIITGGMKGNQITGFLSIYFAGNAAKAIYDFWKSKDFKRVWLPIWWACLMIICTVLYFLGWTW